MLVVALLGQISVAADNLNLVVYGLLVVAALLALLTVWYWRHTKPRPMVIATRSAAEPPAAVDESAASVGAMGDGFDPESVWAESDDKIAFDEWLAITSPDSGSDPR